MRTIVQAVALLISGAILSLLIVGFKGAIHALCPYATVCFGLSKQGFLSLTLGAFWLTTVVSLLILVYTMFYGRRFCGYLCPLGTIQEAIFALRSKKYCLKPRFPYLYELRFAQLKYVILIVTSILSIFGIAYVFMNACPIYALSMLPRIALPGLAIFILAVLAGLFSERFWCRFLCPYAALLNLFQALGSLFGIKRLKIHRNLERCCDCGVCMRYCPMNINIAESEYVHSGECIHCNKCALKCPKPGTFCCEKEL